MKIKTAERADDDSDGAPQPGSEDVRTYASKADTFRAILDVLWVRQSYLHCKGIVDPGHVLIDDQRGELNTYLFCRHNLDDAWKQRKCGSKQIWDMLAFTGGFDIEFLREALHAEQRDDAPEPPAPDLDSQQRREQLVHHAAEAMGRYYEGQRLARQRDQAPPLKMGIFTNEQLYVLQKWDRGHLLEDYKEALSAVGDRHLLTDIGRRIRGASRRIKGNWNPPDWRELLEESD